MKRNNISNFIKKTKKFCIENKIVPILSALISYSYLCFTFISPYNVLSWIILGCLIILFIKTDFSCNGKVKEKKEILILSLFFSFLLLYGGIAYSIEFNRTSSLLKNLFTIKQCLSFIGIFNLVYVLLLNIYPKLLYYKLSFEKRENNKSKRVFIFCLLFMFICWLPYFLRYFPGTMTPDSFSELQTIIDNFTSVTDHHPVIHVLFIAIPYIIGYKLSGSIVVGIATHTVFQMIVLASIFSSFIVFLYKRNISKKILILVLLFYAILPMHGFYSIVMWKDVIFSGLLLLLTMELVKLLEKEKSNELNLKNMISFIIVSILCVFFRNNAIYMYFVLIFFTFIVFKKHYKVFLLSFIIVIGTYGFIKGPVFKWLNISKSSSSEYIAMPLQQVGRMAYKNIVFTKTEEKLISDIIPVNILSDCYNPETSDGIKFNPSFNRESFDKNKGEYFKLWLSLVIKHSSIAIESYTISTLGYWYPGVEYWSVVDRMYEQNELNLKINPKINNKYIAFYLDNSDSKKLPVACMEWSIGLCFWIILVFSLITKKLKDKRSLYVFVPIFGIWITMILAAPVYAEFRYVYGAFVTLPLLVIFPYLKIKK